MWRRRDSARRLPLRPIGPSCEGPVPSVQKTDYWRIEGVSHEYSNTHGDDVFHGHFLILAYSSEDEMGHSDLLRIPKVTWAIEQAVRPD